MRADAQRNRQLLVSAAHEAFVATGPNAPLEDVARRAGVGIGTLYRHFPERTLLLRAVAVDVSRRTAAEAAAAIAEEPDAFAALRRYMHRALEVGIGAVMSLIADELDGDTETMRWRDELAGAQRQLLERAWRERTLRTDIDFADIGLAIVRFSRPIGPRLDPDLDMEFAHRHLDVFIDGLGATDRNSLPGRRLTLEDMRALNEPSTERNEG
jgi:AcrR family transcriptional regulator